MSITQSNTLIANLALARVGTAARITSLDDDNGPGAVGCRLFIDIVLDATLREFPWPFATKIASLSQVEVSPNSEWGYSYRYPPDCQFLRRILSGIRNDSRQTRESFRLSSDDDGILILADLDAAECEYTKKYDDIARLPTDFLSAVAWRLAYEVAPSLGGAAAQTWRADAAKGYGIEMTNARSNAANEEQPDEEPDSEFILARG
jgi:hypothetical protein